MISRSIEWAGLRLAAVLLLLLLGCGCEGAKAPGAAVKRAPPEAVAAVKVKRPTLARIQGNLWVVGLPSGNGWERERRVVLTQHDPDSGVDLKVGVVVVLDDTYATAAPVGIVYEEPGRSFDGASAEVLPADKRLRLGRGFGSISAVVTTTLVEITLGRNDGVGLGDVYEVRSLDGKRAVGRVQVSALEDTRARATVLNPAPMTLGQEVVYQARSAEEQATRAGVKIVVCDFEPKAHTEQMAAVGQAFAHDLAVHLREAAGSWQGLEVMQVPQMVTDHDPARALGRSYQADIVVWGAAMCIEKQGCALPVFTVVDPARLLHAERKGHEVRFDALNPGGSLEHGSAKDPAGLVFGLLGTLAYEAQRFGDAKFFLERVPEGALESVDYYRALRDLAMSLHLLGRIEAALDATGRLELAARGKDREWEAVGVSYRATFLVYKGEVDEALRLFKQVRAVYEATGNRRERSVTLGDIARILAEKGEVDEALGLHREALAVYEVLGDRRSRAMTLGDIARILANKGKVDEALKLRREALAVYEALGDRRSRAMTLGDIADILIDKGEVDEALRLRREELAVYEALGDRRSRAVTLDEIACIFADKGEIDEALKLHREALAVHEALGDRRSRAVTLSEIARILAKKGEVDEALKLHREALAVHEALGDRHTRAVTLGEIARILAKKGEDDEALKLHREALAVHEALGDRRSRSVTLGDMAKIYLTRKDTAAALPLLRESYEIAVAQGDAYGTAFVGQALAMTLLATGAKPQAEPVVARAAEALTKIGETKDADALRALLAGSHRP